MEKKLGALQGILDHARQALRHRAGVPAEQLRHAVRELQTLADFVKEHPEQRTRERVSELAERVGEFHKRMGAWAVENRVYYASVAPTIPSLSTEEINAAIKAMPRGATEPPPAVLAEIVAAVQGPSFDSFADDEDDETSGVPLSAPTAPRLEVVEGNEDESGVTSR